jgi:DNA-binding transcriptional LysR family regulator
MRVTLDALRVLDAIDRRGSFASAACELHRVPSAVVQKIEAEFDVVLFDRSGHRAELTAVGREMLREGRHLLNAAAELEQRVKRIATGFEVELRIGVSDFIPLERIFPLVEEFYDLRWGTASCSP